jgi:integrase/recombinase XerD
MDLNDQTVLIKESKFNKDRLIPISPDLWLILIKYHSHFNQDCCVEEYFFRNKCGAKLTPRWIYEVFRKSLWAAGISHGGRGKGPRVHDFRHSFCVHTLAKQINQKVDLYVALPILSIFLGHDSIAETQNYLRLTAEFYPEMINRVSKKCAYVIPENL